MRDVLTPAWAQEEAYGKEDPSKTLCHSKQLRPKCGAWRKGDSEGLREERTDMCLDSHIIGTEQGDDLLRERVGLREVRVEDSA